MGRVEVREHGGHATLVEAFSRMNEFLRGKHVSPTVPQLPPIEPRPDLTVTPHYPSAASHRPADVTSICTF